jgi:kynurenine formamidase
VLAALRHLCVKYGMMDYVLIGHSAGATLGFQCLHELRQRREGKADVSGGGPLREPRMVVGVEGIYDLASLVDEYPQYQGFVEGAFGEEADGRGVWESASPRKFGVSGYKGLVVLAQSDEDTLLSWRQTEEMKEAVERDLGVGGGLRVVKVVGQHHDVVEKCYERLAGVVERYLKEPA